jgi:hypothetical protein
VYSQSAGVSGATVRSNERADLVHARDGAQDFNFKKKLEKS